MKKIRRYTVVIGVLLLSLTIVPIAAAHPLGNFTINHYAGLRISHDAIAIDFVLDMAEIPAFQEISAMDPGAKSLPDPARAAAYHPAQCETIRSQLAMQIDGQPVALTLDSSAIGFPPGAGGLPTLRLTCAFSASTLTTAQSTSLKFQDNSYADRIGWREIVVTGDGVSIQGDVVSTSVSQRLTVYPNDMLSNPLDVREVSLSFTPTGAPSQPALQPANLTKPSISNRNDPFTQQISIPNLDPGPILLAVLIAFIWGAAHAFSPGHGKTIVAAYLVGSRSTARHAVFLGATTTLTHTAGVFALGLLTLFASRYVVPEQLFPWLETISGVLVMSIGLSLFVRRLRRVSSHDHAHHDPDHEHDHHHDHNPDHEHSHDSLHDHPHPHGDHTHTHLPPSADGAPVTWRSLLALGISGGLLPCPSALVVMLGAIALNRVGFGLLLICVFSLGLAGTLTVVGLLMVRAKTILAHIGTGDRLWGRIPLNRRVIQVLPAVSALFIVLAGIGIVLTALAQTGMFKV